MERKRKSFRHKPVKGKSSYQKKSTKKRYPEKPESKDNDHRPQLKKEKKKNPLSLRIKKKTLPVEKIDTPGSKSSGSDDSIRLNRYIANAGVCSRRDADLLIAEGKITVNGKKITEMGYKVNKSDIIKYQGKTLRREQLVYVLLNKPKDFITTTDDPENRRTVMQLVENACEERILPVGRLDRNTTGLLLFTNDGELAAKLSHPSHAIKKLYQVELNNAINNEDITKINNGLRLEDGEVKVDDIAIISKDKKTLGVEIHIGKNRIVRRIFEHLGYEVLKLDRVIYAGLTKKDLKRGHWRYLKEKEVVRLKYLK